MTKPNATKLGGARPGAGRKKGSGKFGEPTKVMRLPESKIPQIKHWLSQQAQAEKVLNAAEDQITLFKPDWHKTQPIPFYSHKVIAGFPSPADDYVEARLDLNEKLIRNKESTFILTVQGDSMKKAGIREGDLLIVDKSIEPTDGKIVIAAIDGELTVKRLSLKSTGAWLVPENDDYPPIPIKEENDVIIWGIVTATISQY